MNDENPYRASQVVEPSSTNATPDESYSGWLHPAARAALRRSLTCLLGTLAISSLLLDGGRIFRGFAIVAAVQWFIAFVLIAYRRERPSKVSCHFVAYGLLYSFVFFLLLMQATLKSEN